MPERFIRIVRRPGGDVLAEVQLGPVDVLTMGDEEIEQENENAPARFVTEVSVAIPSPKEASRREIGKPSKRQQRAAAGGADVEQGQDGPAEEQGQDAPAEDQGQDQDQSSE